MSDDQSSDSGARESFSPEEAAAELHQAREAAAAAGLGPSHEAMREARAFDGPEHNWSSNSEGLTGAAAELAQARAEASKQRPPPPSPGDIISGEPGGEMKWILPGDPDKPWTARKAAESISAGRVRDEASIGELERAFADAGLSWSDVLDGKVRIDPAAPEAPAQPQASAELEQARQQAAEAQAEAQRQQQIAESERQARAASDQMNDQVRMARYVVQNEAAKLQQKYPDIVYPSDLQRVWTENPQRAGEYAKAYNEVSGLALQTEALARRASDVSEHTAKVEGKRQDDLFLAAHPEYNDTKQAPALQRAAIAALKSAGWTEEELTHEWQRGDSTLRNHRTQSFIARQVALEQENALLKAQLGQGGRTNGRLASNRVPPPMMAPGVAGSPTRGVESDIRALNRQLAKPHTANEGAKLGMQLLQAHRAAANRGY